MKLPMPPPAYNVADQAQMRAALERANTLAHKRNQDVEIGRARLILSDADGVRWEVYVDTAGALLTRTV